MILDRVSPAEKILQTLGISDPAEIDLEVIAWSMGVVNIKYRGLEGCEARIVGLNDKAIITVDNRAIPTRKRFSVGHELGHWHHHRGRTLHCRSEDIGDRHGANAAEQAANRFAADLLLPQYLLMPIARKHPRLTLKALREIAGTFDASMTATAIRLAEFRHSPVILVWHTKSGRKRFFPSPDVPEKWFPREKLDSESFAFEMLFGGAGEQTIPRKVGAEAWFDRYDAERYEICEQSYKVADDEIVTLLTFPDDRMLD